MTRKLLILASREPIPDRLLAFCLGLFVSVGGRAGGQAQPESPSLARDVFENVPLFGDMPVDQFMDTMGMISGATSINCVDCHFDDGSLGWGNYAVETPRKQTTRAMIRMVGEINRTNFGGVPLVTCFTCHDGYPRPKATLNLEVQYGVPPEDPNEVFFPTEPAPSLPTVNVVFDRYLAALGGRDQLDSFVALGTYTGYDTNLLEVPLEIFAASPDRRTTVVQARFGASVRTYGEDAAWIASADRPLPLIELTGPHLAGARMDAMLAFPAQVRELATRWRVGFPTFIDDREVQVVQGIGYDDLPVNMYFDAESGFLVRLVRFAETPIGNVPTQIDYADYREVSGVMMPFRWTETWSNGQSTIQLTEVRANVPIDPVRFERPAPAEPLDLN